MSAIGFEGVSFAYPDRDIPALDDVGPEFEGGDLVLVLGASGSGKSTLLRAINGLVPHSSGGRFRGNVVVFGRNTRTHRPRELADVVGFVSQDPEAQFVVDRVEHDVAFVLENLAMPAPVMRRRVEEALDALGIAHLRDRSPGTLSGGERQRVAIAGALAAAPRALVLDEPTSQLDPQGADDVFAALARLNADLGTTVVLAEHRHERAAPMAHRAIVMDSGRVGPVVSPAEALAVDPGAPSVTRLGVLLGWDPLPLTVREARALAAVDPRIATLTGSTVDGPTRSAGPALVSVAGLVVDLGGRAVLHDVECSIGAGEIVALLGRNGAGKTTLLRAMAGLVSPTRGTVTAVGAASYVPQNPNALLFAPTVRDELLQTTHLLGRRDPVAVDRWLVALDLDTAAARHPRSLSGGERQRVAIGAVAVGGAPVLLLDEPTRGMDARARDALERTVTDHAARGGAVVIATHDVELAARVATRAIVLADGEVVADGPAAPVLGGSLFAPQISRVIPGFLTLRDVETALAPIGNPSP